MHAADRALERISIAFAAMSIARSAPNRELARGMKELGADAADGAAAASRRSRLAVSRILGAGRSRKVKLLAAFRTGAVRRIVLVRLDVVVETDLVLVFIHRRRRDVLRTIGLSGSSTTL